MNKIFIIVGKSSTGKDTIKSHIKEYYMESLNLKEIVSYTTRPKRNGEVDGIDYHFVTKKKFVEDKHSGDMIEYRTYQTTKGLWTYYNMKDGIDLENHSYLTIGTIESIVSFGKVFGMDKICPIYITCSDKYRLLRSIEREEKSSEPDYKQVCVRFLNDDKDYNTDNINLLSKYSNNTNFIFTNNTDDIDSVCKDIIKYIKENILGGTKFA